MPVDAQLRRLQSAEATELYVTATPAGPGDGSRAAGELFAAVDSQAAACGGNVVRLRAFVPSGAAGAWRQAAGGRPCTWLAAGEGACGGLQAHIVAGGRWLPLADGQQATGWHSQGQGARWAVVSGLCVPAGSDPAADAAGAFERAGAMLQQAGMTLGDVARTWFFLDDILGWYDRFNAGRSDVFRRRGLLVAGGGDASTVPASTGIGVAPLDGQGPRPRIAMELLAVSGPAGSIVRKGAAGRQRSAYEYGSAFARAACAATPGGRTAFISGTAAIDAAGKTCFVGDAAGQIRMTLANVQAVLSELGCRADDALEAVAYCKTPQVAELFEAQFRHSLPWPWLTAVGDICRDDLLFEVEVTAAIQSA
jgi:enamine deaminase RidA (YjgF/YER057c/UK114 family)